MNIEEKRIKIATACGWIDIHKQSFTSGSPLFTRWEEPCGTNPRDREVLHLPDYFNDLNAMHEAERVILSKLCEYGKALTLICDTYAAHNGYEHLESWRTTATAAQRAEAFGLTLQLWKEGE